FNAHTFFLLGVEPPEALSEGLSFLQTLYAWMTETGADWPQTFFDLFGGRYSADRRDRSPQSALYADSLFSPVKSRLDDFEPASSQRLSHPYFQSELPVRLLIDDIEDLWAPIAERDDWSALEAKLAHIAQLGHALGTIPDS
ncbi:MAG: selenoprotein O, partial [Pseudomonadota bacterium]